MEYGRIPGIDKQVSRIVTGTGQVEQGGDIEGYFKVWDAAYAAGINVIDSGREYADGYAEQCMGKWLKSRGVRKNGDHLQRLPSQRLSQARDAF